MKKTNSITAPALPAQPTILSRTDITRSHTNRIVNDKTVADLVDSVRERGIIQPLLVRPAHLVTDEKIKKAIGTVPYVIVAGERRWVAAGLVNLDQIPVLIKNLSDREALILQAIENLQRKDLTDLEEAEQYRRMLDAGDTAEEVGQRIGKSRAHVYNCLKLLELPPEGLEALKEGKLERAIALLVARLNPAVQKEALQKILQGDYDHHAGKNLPYSFRDAKRLLAHHFMLELSHVAWDLNEEGIFKQAPSCTNCPKRAGNLPDLFGELTRQGDLCTDAACFHQKKEATWQRLRAKAEEAGKVIIEEKEAQKLFPYQGDSLASNSGYVKLDDTCYEDSKMRTYRQLLGKNSDHVAIARSPAGTPVELIPKSALKVALEEKGVKLNERRSSSDEEKKAREEGIIFREVQQKTVASILEKLTKQKNAESIIWQLVMSWLTHSASFDTRKTMLSLHGIESKDPYRDFTKLSKTIQPADRPMFALKLALWGAYHNTYHSMSPLLQEGATALKIDLKAVTKSVREERKTQLREKTGKKTSAPATATPTKTKKKTSTR